MLTFILFLINVGDGISYISMLFLSPTLDDQESIENSRYAKDEVYRKEEQVLVISSLIAPIIQTSSYVILIRLYWLQRKAGLHTSGPTWFYLLVALLCDLFNFYSVLVANQPRIHIEKLIHFPVLTLLFVLECKGDNPVVEPDLFDTNNLSVISFLS